jgi:hypothetical protein
MSDKPVLFTATSDDETYRYEVTENCVKLLSVVGGGSIEYDPSNGNAIIRWEKKKVTIPAQIFFSLPEALAMMHSLHGNLLAPVKISRVDPVCTLFGDVPKKPKRKDNG